MRKCEISIISDHCEFSRYIHSAGLIHCDIRPRNCLVNANCDLKISDFGQARVNFSTDVYKLAPMTEYVCTRWYRAPEALCSWNSYTAGIDIWSTGCTFAEMMSGKPLFPGQSTRHQLYGFAQPFAKVGWPLAVHIYHLVLDNYSAAKECWATSPWTLF